MDRPLTVHRYIALRTDNIIDKNVVRDWFNCVRVNAPSGVVQSLQTTDDKGEPRSVKVIRRETDGGNYYLIPLTRDLNNSEVEEIVNVFSEENPDMDFDIETNARFMADFEKDSISIDQAKHLELCKALAKHKHEDWMRERTDSGWRYGPRFDADEKVHPLLMPWDQLPERYKAPDLELPQKMVDILSQQGYAVISKDDLSELISALDSK